MPERDVQQELPPAPVIERRSEQQLEAYMRRICNNPATEERGASAPDHLKIACPNCSKRIEFPRERLGQIIDCPGCGLSVALHVASIDRGAATKRESPTLPTQTASASPTTPLGHREQPKSSWNVSHIGCLGVLCVFIWLIVFSNFVGDRKAGVNSVDPAKYPTDPANQEHIKAGILAYTAAGVFTDLKVYDGDQAWVYVSDRFSKLPIGEKEMSVAGIYRVLHHQNSIKFVVVYDANTGKSVGTYHPNLGLKMD